MISSRFCGGGGPHEIDYLAFQIHRTRLSCCQCFDQPLVGRIPSDIHHSHQKPLETASLQKCYSLIVNRPLEGSNSVEEIPRRLFYPMVPDAFMAWISPSAYPRPFRISSECSPILGPGMVISALVSDNRMGLSSTLIGPCSG